MAVCLGMIGIALIVAAAVVSSGLIETLLLGQSEGQLRWGPTLFRLLLVFHGMVFLVASGYGLAFPTPISRDDVSDAAQCINRSNTTRPWHWAALVFLCLIALALRVACLNAGLWHDEIGTLVTYLRSSFGTILTSLPNQNNHILYSLLTRTLMTYWGDAEWVLRMPAVLFGVGSIWALFLLGRCVVSNVQSLLACLLLTVSYHHIWFSQNARGYTGVLMFTLMATWLFLEGLPRNQWRWWMGYVVCVALGMWVHMSLAFVVASHGLVYLARLVLTFSQGDTNAPKSSIGCWWKPLVAFALCVTVTLQLYALALPDFLNSGLHEESLDSDWVNPLWVAFEMIRGLMTAFSGPRLILGGAVLVCGLMVLLTGWISFLRENWAFGVIIVLPGVLIFSTMYLLQHNLWPRFAFFCAGFALLVVVRGAFEFPRWLGQVVPHFSNAEWLCQCIGFCIMGLIAVASIASLPHYYALPKQDYVGALRFVEDSLGPKDVAAAAGLAAVAYGEHYAPHWSTIENTEQLLLLRQEYDQVWVVVSLQIHIETWHPEIWKLLNSEFELVRSFPGTLRGGDVLVYRDLDAPRSISDHAILIRRATQSRRLFFLHGIREEPPC